MRFAALLGILVAIGSASAETQSPTSPKVAIIPGVAVNIDTPRVDALAEQMAEALTAELVVEAVGGLTVRRQLPAEGVPADCVAKPECVADVAKRTGATELLFVVMVDAGGTIQVDSTWVDPATGRSETRPAIDIAVLGEAKARFTGAAKQLLPGASVRAKSQPGIGGTMTKEIPRHFTAASYATAGIAVVGLGVGIGFAIRTKGLFDDCNKPDAPCTDAQEDKIRTSALIADVGWAAFLGGAVATAILYATSGSESRLVITPEAERGGVTLTAVGRF